MPSRRRHRIAMLPPEDVRAIERQAGAMFDAIRRALTKLVPFNDSYSALHKLGDDMRVALNVIAGRPADHVEPYFGQGAMPGEPAGDERDAAATNGKAAPE
jgi:hypothetical protein